MSSLDNKNWDLIHKILEAEASGKAPRMFSSQRTLFGIPSELDRELAAYAAGEEQTIEPQATRSASQEREEVQEYPDTQEPQGSQEREGAQDDQETSSPEKSVAPKVTSRHAPEKLKRVDHPLEPVFDDASRVLILGTMPSPKSRETGFYYNHPQNRFWPVMARIFDEPVPTTNDQKKALVLKHHIALWDVLASCEIDGAKDVSIAQCVPNDIALITTKAPIRAIFCTGAKAAELYERYCKDRTGIDCVRLPSTSPANAAWSLDELVKAYEQIVPLVQE